LACVNYGVQELDEIAFGMPMKKGQGAEKAIYGRADLPKSADSAKGLILALALLEMS
jgi:hypothetical protein